MKRTKYNLGAFNDFNPFTTKGEFDKPRKLLNSELSNKP